MKKGNKGKKMVESIKVPLGPKDESMSLIAQAPSPLASQSDEYSLDFAILLSFLDEAIAKGKKKGENEQRKERWDIGKKKGIIFLLRVLGFK